MSKQHIDIGIQGNDGTGDSIRDSFRKVNDNFTELYSIFGLSGTIGFTALSDAPRSYGLNQIIMSSNDGSKLTARNIVEGTNISISKSSNDSITISSLAGKLHNDDSPYLIAPFDANNKAIGNVPDPSQLYLDQFNSLYPTNTTTLAKLAVNKGYVDSNFVAGTTTTAVDANGLTDTGYHIALPVKSRTQPTTPPFEDKDYNSSLSGNYLSTEIMQRKDVVYRGGDTMTGPLTLSDHPAPLEGAGTPNTSSDLQAATKFYVDNNVFSSSVNLYVSTSGDDLQTKSPPGREGRFWQYAYRTVGAAAAAAENLISLAGQEPGPYRQRLTYSIGVDQYFSTVQNTQVINGNVSVTGYLDAYNLLLVNKPFIQSETIAYINSKYVNTYTYNRLQKKTEIATLLSAIGTDLVLGSTYNVSQLAGRYLNNADLGATLSQTLAGINYARDQVLQFSYNNTQLKSYIDQVITAITYDLVFQSNFQSMLAGMAFSRAGTNVSNFEIIPTLNYVKTQILTLGSVSTSPSVSSFISGSFDVITSIIGTGVIPTISLPTPATTISFTANFSGSTGFTYISGTVPRIGMVLSGNAITNANTYIVSGDGTNFTLNRSVSFGSSITVSASANSQNNARDLLLGNINFIQSEVISYLSANYPTFTYNKNTKKQNIKLILEALAFDITYGGNTQSLYAAQQYWNGDQRTIADYEVAPTLASITYINTLAQSVILNATPAIVYQTTVPQFRNETLNGVMTWVSASLTSNTTTIYNYVNTQAASSTITPDLTEISDVLTTARTDVLAGNTGSNSYRNKAATYIETHYPLITSEFALSKITSLTSVVTSALTYGENSLSEHISTTGISANGTRITITFATRGAIPYVTGQTIVLNGVKPAGYNGIYTVYSCSLTQVVVTSTISLGSQTQAGTVNLVPTYANPTGLTSAFYHGRDAILANIDFITQEATNWIASQVAANQSPFSNTFNYYGDTLGQYKTQRNLKYILEAICYDLTYALGAQNTNPVNVATINASNLFANITATYLTPSQAARTIERVRSVANNVAQNAVVIPSNALTALNISGSGTYVSITFSTQLTAPYKTGDTIVVANCSPSSYNGTWVVYDCSTTVVRFQSAVTDSPISQYGVVYKTNQIRNSSWSDGLGAGDRINSLLSTASLIVETQSVVTPISPVISNTVYSSELINVNSVISNNSPTIQTSVVNYLDTTFKGNFTYNEATLYKDIGNIVDGMAIDIITGGTWQSVYAGKSYYSNATSRAITIGSQLTQTLDAINYAKTLGLQTLNQVVSTNYQSSVPQYTGTLSILNITGDGVTATITFVTQNISPHAIGDSITVAGVVSTTPGTGSYNGTFTVTGVTTSSVSFTSATNATYLSGGTVTKSWLSAVAARDTFSYNMDTIISIIKNGIGVAPTPTFGTGLWVITFNNGGANGSVDQGSANNNDIIPAKVLVGLGNPDTNITASGAYGSIVKYIRASSPTTDTIQLRLTRPGFYKLGEQLEFGETIRDLNITIFVESGIYYEDYPIRLSANVSIKGDEFRRTIIRPLNRVSQSIWRKVFFYRDSVIDGMLLGLLNTSVDYSTSTSINISGKSGTIVITLNSGQVPTSWLGRVVQVAYTDQGGTGTKIGRAVIDSISNNFMNCSVIYPFYTIGTVASGSWKLYAPNNYGRHYLTNPLDVNSTPKNNTEIDAFLCNDAVRIGNVTFQGHGGFAMVLDPEGQIKTKSPYGQVCSSFSQSNNRQRFAGGQFVDGFAGRVFGNITNVVYDQITSLIITSGGTGYAPLSGTNVYTNVPLTNSNTPRATGYPGSRATADITVTNGVVTNVVINNAGIRYVVGDVLSATAANLGGTGSGLILTVASITESGNGITITVVGSANSGLDIRAPQPPCAFFVEGNRYQVNDVVSFDAQNRTVVLTVDTGTPYDAAGFYNNDKCSRDVGYILDAVGYDLMLGSNFQSVKAGLSYLRSYSNVVTNLQKSQTIAGINYARDQALLAVPAGSGYDSYRTAITTLMNNIVSIIDQGTLGAPSLTYSTNVSPLTPQSADLIKAKNIIIANKTFIKNEITAWITDPAGGNINTRLIPGYSAVTFQQNVTYILDAIVYDLFYGGNSQTKNSAEAYYLNGISYVPGQETTYAQAYGRLKTILSQIVAGTSVTRSAGNVYSQTTSNAPASASAFQTTLNGLSDLLIDYVRDGVYNTPVSTVYPTVPSSGNAYATNQALQTAKSTIQYNTITFLNAGAATGINIEMGGNKSMLANDFAMINDLGYAIVCTNGAVSEQVSTFTYYCHTHYWANNGGQIRSVAGSNAHGNYGLRASGYDVTEKPDDVVSSYDMVSIARVYKQGVVANEMTPTATVKAIAIWITDYAYAPLSGSEVEIDHTLDGFGIVRYEINTIEHTSIQVGTKNILKLNLSTAGNNGTSSTGLATALYDGQSIVVRMLSQVKFSGIANVKPTRPSTALQYKDNLADIYRILSYNLTESTGELFALNSGTAVLQSDTSFAYYKFTTDTANLATVDSDDSTRTQGASVGDIKIAVVAINSQSEIDQVNKGTYLVGWGGRVHRVVSYTAPVLIATGTLYSYTSVSSVYTVIVSNVAGIINLGAAVIGTNAGYFTNGTVVNNVILNSTTSSGTFSTYTSASSIYTLTVTSVAQQIYVGQPVSGGGINKFSLGTTVASVTGTTGTVIVTLSQPVLAVPDSGSTIVFGIVGGGLTATVVISQAASSPLGVITFGVAKNAYLTIESNSIVNLVGDGTGIASMSYVGTSSGAGNVRYVTYDIPYASLYPPVDSFGTFANCLTSSYNGDFQINGLVSKSTLTVTSQDSLTSGMLAVVSSSGTYVSNNTTTLVVNNVTGGIQVGDIITGSNILKEGSGTPVAGVSVSGLTVSGVSTSGSTSTITFNKSIGSITLGGTYVFTNPVTTIIQEIIDVNTFVVSPAIIVSPGMLVTATLVAVIKEIDIVPGYAGFGYTDAPAITISGGGALVDGAASCTIDSQGRISKVTVVSPGFGYTSVPNVTVATDTLGVGGTPALLNAVLTTTAQYYSTATSSDNTIRIRVGYQTPPGKSNSISATTHDSALIAGAIISGNTLTITDVVIGTISVGMVLSGGVITTYPYITNVNSVSFVGTLYNNSLTVTSNSPTVSVGMVISGTGIPTGTYIISGSSGNFSLSGPCSSNSGISILGVSYNISQNITQPLATISATLNSISILPPATITIGGIISSGALSLAAGSILTPVATVVGTPAVGMTVTGDATKPCTITAVNTATFNGTISGTILTVSGIVGTISVGMGISGLADGTRIVSGSGNSWTVTPSQTVATSTAMTGTSYTVSVSQLVLATTFTATQMAVNDVITFSGTEFGNIIANTTYYITGIISSNAISVSPSRGGANLTLSTSSGKMTYYDPLFSHGTQITATGFVSKTGSGPYSIVLSFLSTTAPTKFKYYHITNNTNKLYNGFFYCTDSSTTTITLTYPYDPGVWGTTVLPTSNISISGASQLTVPSSLYSTGQSLIITGTLTNATGAGLTAGTYYIFNSPPVTVLVTGTATSTNIISATNSLIAGNIVVFNTSFNGISANTTYYVLSNNLSSSGFTVSLTPSGTPVSITVGGAATAIGTVSSSNSTNFSLATSLSNAVANIGIGTLSNGSVSGLSFTLSSLSYITNESVSSTSRTLGIGKPFSLTNAATLRLGYPAGSPAQITVRISTCRATGHDFLDIGTGSYSTTNYPYTIYGNPAQARQPSQEITENGVGRVFYVTTDQNGIFRVGRFFSVDQGTGTVTFSAAIALSNLDGIGFKRGVVVSEFSTDATLTANATDVVPVQSAIRGYVERKLGLDGTGSPVTAGNLLGPGFLDLLGTLSMKGTLQMASNFITGVLTPGLTFTPSYTTDPFNAANKAYVDQEVYKRNSLYKLDDVFISGTTYSGGYAVPGTAEAKVSQTIVYNNLTNKWNNATLTGDITFSYDGTVLVSTIGSKKITNSMVSDTAGIAQSKLLMKAATTKAAGTPTQADLGLAVFDNTAFTATGITNGDSTVGGFITLSSNGVAISKLAKIAAGTVLANLTTGASSNVAVNSTNDVVKDGNAVTNDKFTSAGVLYLSSKADSTSASGATNIGGANSYTTVGVTTTGGSDSLVRTLSGSTTSGFIDVKGVKLNGNGGFTWDSTYSQNVSLGTDVKGTFQTNELTTGGNAGVISSGYLVPGGIYTILSAGAAPGFNTIGAANNSVGTTFTATGAGLTGSTGTVQRIGLISGAWRLSANANIDFATNNTVLSVTNITTGGGLTAGTITGTWSLGAQSTFQATYADLAEYYEGDQEYEMGTVLVFGGEKEVTTTTEMNDTRSAGVVTANPAYVMNKDQKGIKVCIALAGRVPCKVVGRVRKGDMLTTSATAGYAVKANTPTLGAIIGKALEDKDYGEAGVIQVAVGRV